MLHKRVPVIVPLHEVANSAAVLDDVPRSSPSSPPCTVDAASSPLTDPPPPFLSRPPLSNSLSLPADRASVAAAAAAASAAAAAAAAAAATAAAVAAAAVTTTAVTNTSTTIPPPASASPSHPTLPSIPSSTPAPVIPPPVMRPLRKNKRLRPPCPPPSSSSVPTVPLTRAARRSDPTSLPSSTSHPPIPSSSSNLSAAVAKSSVPHLATSASARPLPVLQPLRDHSVSRSVPTSPNPIPTSRPTSKPVSSRLSSKHTSGKKSLPSVSDVPQPTPSVAISVDRPNTNDRPTITASKSKSPRVSTAKVTTSTSSQKPSNRPIQNAPRHIRSAAAASTDHRGPDLVSSKTTRAKPTATPTTPNTPRSSARAGVPALKTKRDDITTGGGGSGGPAKKKRRMEAEVPTALSLSSPGTPTATLATTIQPPTPGATITPSTPPTPPSPARAEDVSTAALLAITAQAAQHKIVWTKIKGHPFWPSQHVTTTDELLQEPRFQAAVRFRRRADSVCVMYFGTCEIAYVNPEKACISWEAGLKRSLHLAQKTRASFRRALQEVRAFCNPRAIRYPRGWWCEPPVLVLAAEFVEHCARSKENAPPPKRLSSGISSGPASSSVDLGISPGNTGGPAIRDEPTAAASSGTLPGSVGNGPIATSNGAPSLRRDFAHADGEHIHWAKMRGFPQWPVQKLPVNVAMEKFPQLKLREVLEGKMGHAGHSAQANGSNIANIPCMFFGTAELALVSEKQLTPFIAGISRGYVNASSRDDFQVALGEVYGYLKFPRVWPSGFLSRTEWWNAPDNGEDGNGSADGKGGGASGSQSNSDGMSAGQTIPRYTHIRKSVWADNLQPVSTQDMVRCSCSWNPDPEKPQCIDNSCLNFASRFLCPSNCLAKERCANHSFHLRSLHKMKPFFTGSQRGWGLRVEEPVKAGSFVIEYVGEIIDRDELDHRLQKTEKENSHEYYMMDLNNELLVDAKVKGNLSRFINSSCEPNCQTQKWTVGSTGQTHVGIFALRDIPAGTELTYNYCFQDFGLSGKSRKRSFSCACGTASCCMLDPREQVLMKRLVGRRVEVLWDDGWYPGMVELYDMKKKRFRVQYDDGDCEDLLLGLNLDGIPDDGVAFRVVDDGRTNSSVGSNGRKSDLSNGKRSDSSSGKKSVGSGNGRSTSLVRKRDALSTSKKHESGSLKKAEGDSGKKESSTNSKKMDGMTAGKKSEGATTVKKSEPVSISKKSTDSSLKKPDGTALKRSDSVVEGKKTESTTGSKKMAVKGSSTDKMESGANGKKVEVGSNPVSGLGSKMHGGSASASRNATAVNNGDSSPNGKLPKS